jgi:ATP-dependent Clp protease ATP-binding subunit ClpA
MFERFTRPARAVVESATSYAREAGAGETRPEHLLQAVLDQEDCLAVRVLADARAPAGEMRVRLAGLQERYVDGLDADDAEALQVIGIDLGEVVRRMGRVGGRPRGRTRPRFSRGAKKTLELSLREALALRHDYIGTEHILLGLARADDRVVDDVLAAFGIEKPSLRDAVGEALRRAG